MLLLKIASLIVVYIIALIKDFWADKLKRHLQTKRALVTLMTLAMLIGVVSTVLDDQKSSEVSRLQSERQAFLQSQNDSLRARVDSLIKITQQGEVKLDRQNAVLQAKVSELNSKLEPFVKLAVTKYPAYDIQSALNQLARDIAEAKELAKPATLVLYAKEISKIDGGHSLKLQFKPSKNVTLGLIEFSATIPPTSRSRIFDFWPTLDGGAFQSGSDSKKISTYGKSAKLTYSLMGAGYPTIELKVTEQTDVIIGGNHLSTPVKIRIE
jgi:hypothetical protein